MKYRNMTNMTLSLGGAYVLPYGDIDLDEATMTPRMKLNIKDGNLVEASKAPSVDALKKKRPMRDTVSASDIPDARVENVHDGVITVDPDDVVIDPNQGVPGLKDSDSATELIAQVNKIPGATVSAAPAKGTSPAEVKEETPAVAIEPEKTAEAISPSEQSSAGSFIIKDRNNPMGGTEKSLDELLDEKSASVTSAAKGIVDKLTGKKN